MSGRAIVFAAIASVAVTVIGAVSAAATLVVVGLVSLVVAGMLLVIKADDTTQPMGQLLFDERRV
jgi:hypothetical protein